jgi:hypothetical protein
MSRAWTLAFLAVVLIVFHYTPFYALTLNCKSRSRNQDDWLQTKSDGKCVKGERVVWPDQYAEPKQKNQEDYADRCVFKGECIL